MKIRNVALLVVLCCTVLLGGAGTSQSVEVGESAEPVQGGERGNNLDLNLGLATTQPMLLNGSTAALSVSEAGQHRDLNGDGDMSDEVAHVFDATSGEVRNLGVSINAQTDKTGSFAGAPPLLQGRVFAFWAPEGPADLNGDGDASDTVLHVYDTARRSLTNLRLASAVSTDPFGFAFDGRRLAFGVDEANQGQRDLNQDGDTDDKILHVFDTLTGRIQNTTLPVIVVDPLGVVVRGRWIAAAVAERDAGFSLSAQGQVDLNGDGDLTDVVVHLFDTATGRVVNLRLATMLTDINNFKLGTDVAVVPVPEFQQGTDLNGDQDQSDFVLHVVDLASGRIRNTACAIEGFGPFASFISTPPTFDLEKNLLAFSVVESEQGNTDLNGDGDTGDAVVHLLSTRSGQIRNLRVEGFADLVDDDRAVLFMFEFSNDQDLNGDGDRFDCVLGLVDLSRDVPRIVNTRRAFSFFGGGLIPPFAPIAFQKFDGLVTFLVDEAGQGNRDLNADGDSDDFVLHISDLSTFTTRNTGLEGTVGYRSVLAPLLPASSGRIVVPTRESDQGGRDLNGDGDAADTVLQIVDLRSGMASNTRVTTATESPFFEFPLVVRGESFVSFPVPEGNLDLNQTATPRIECCISSMSPPGSSPMHVAR